MSAIFVIAVDCIAVIRGLPISPGFVGEELKRYDFENR
jgi:hypothetical protein